MVALCHINIEKNYPHGSHIWAICDSGCVTNNGTHWSGGAGIDRAVCGNRSISTASSKFFDIRLSI